MGWRQAPTWAGPRAPSWAGSQAPSGLVVG
ncbi:unnamed protein product [Cuscuta europaea]|nr:unnamed protein product [Cuscuta europaea]